MAAIVIPLGKKELGLSARTDDELMLLAAQDVYDAFEELVRRHGGRVRGYCRKSVGDAPVGDELAQEVWLSVWGHRGEYRAEGRFVVWLFTVAKNRVRNAHRERVRHPAGLEAPVASEKADLSPSELDRLVALERRRRVAHALTKVSDTLREALVLRFTDELPYAQMAEILDTNESTARSRVFHGLRELRRLLKGDP